MRTLSLALVFVAGTVQAQSAQLQTGITERKGNVAGARAEYSEALRLNPELKDARTALDKLPKA